MPRSVRPIRPRQECGQRFGHHLVDDVNRIGSQATKSAASAAPRLPSPHQRPSRNTSPTVATPRADVQHGHGRAAVVARRHTAGSAASDTAAGDRPWARRPCRTCRARRGSPPAAGSRRDHSANASGVSNSTPPRISKADRRTRQTPRSHAKTQRRKGPRRSGRPTRPNGDTCTETHLTIFRVRVQRCPSCVPTALSFFSFLCLCDFAETSARLVHCCNEYSTTFSPMRAASSRV